ncbi:RNA polymerase sigma factor SigE [Georgenia sp. EYE_87]|uniref:RNA polymerase sigma factor SigE n=1 Tax=Georgenia sp. EYE_87 TaxID=2853448 RepID=UPI002002E0E9|nr:RNA polymerase sigma factor SigE [Georgenia sp. EYE_87]MCK6210019.1 RNA polymerase sigma factor SigE [Georgenia sp. EYE_87]
MLHANRPTDDDRGAPGADGGAFSGDDGAAPVAAADGGAHPGNGGEPPVWSPPSWEQIVVEHSPRVYRLAYRLTGNKADAEDLTQETFVRVFRSLHKYEPGNFEGWLHRITTNLFLDQARRRTRVRMDPIGEATERLPAAHDSGEPERGFEHAHLDLDVQAALDALPPKYRAAVVLCDIEGLSYEEIAATLGIKMGTVRSRIHRARAMLRDQLAHRRPATAANPVHAAQGVG